MLPEKVNCYPKKWIATPKVANCYSKSSAIPVEEIFILGIAGYEHSISKILTVDDTAIYSNSIGSKKTYN